MSPQPVFKKVLQVGFVVRDLDKAVRSYWDDFGIGPWAIYNLDKDSIKNPRVNGKPAEIALRAAFADLGGVQLELIEPLNENIYTEFLEKHGDGLHHIAVEVDDFDATIARLQEKGIRSIQDGETKDGLGFAYLATQEALSCITEIYKIPKGLKYSPPDQTYPQPGKEPSP
ncbi:MAG: VOC family protein [Desulfuromonadales bacterium]|nr:VOC family protein [Desulfuromonadales bacterium]